MRRMKRTTLRAVSTAALCACTATLLAACGAQTKTVAVSSVPPVSQTSSTVPSTTKTTGTTTTPTQTSTTGTTTRASPEPAFTQNEAKAEGASAAAAVVRAQGYTPNNTSDYH